jgi:hypothetical protein
MATIVKGILNRLCRKDYIVTHCPILRSWNAFGSDTVYPHARGGHAATGNSQKLSTEQIGELHEQIGELSVVLHERLIGSGRRRHGKSVVSIAQIGGRSAMNGELQGEVDAVRDSLFVFGV